MTFCQEYSLKKARFEAKFRTIFYKFTEQTGYAPVVLNAPLRNMCYCTTENKVLNHLFNTFQAAPVPYEVSFEM